MRKIRKRRSLRANLLILVGLFALMWGVGLYSQWMNNRVPDVDTAAQDWAPPAPVTTTPATPTTTPPPLPPGFPSMEFPPPKIEVPAGQPQPIATKFGLTYDIPADWRNFSTGVAGWTDNSETVTYGAVGLFGDDYCPESGYRSLALSGATGRRGMDIIAAATEEADKLERMAAEPDSPDFRSIRSSPENLELDGRPAVRITISVTGLPREVDCDPHGDRYDIIATPALATADVMLLVVKSFQGLPGSLDESVAGDIITTIRAS